jgi:hypothetical protein
VLNFAFQKFYVIDSRFALVLVRQPKHFVSHIETISFAGWPDSLGREQDIDTATGAKIEDNFAGIQFGQSCGVPAAL